MQILKRLYGVNIYGCAVKLKRAFEGIDETAKHRRKVIDFYQEYGKRATLDAIGISKSTLYNWLVRFIIIRLGSDYISTILRRCINKYIDGISMKTSHYSCIKSTEIRGISRLKLSITP